MGRVRITSGEWFRYFNWKEGMCSVNSLAVTARPASSKATFNPASESLLAAQPPVAPEPTTIASYVCCRTSCAMECLGVGRARVHAAFIGAVDGFSVPAKFLLTDF